MSLSKVEFFADWKGLALAAALFFAAGCGFSPLHADKSNQSDGSTAGLALVDIQQIPDRQGQILRNFLIDDFGVRLRGGSKAKYGLAATISVSKKDLGTQLDATTVRAALTVRAEFEFTGGGAKKTFSSTSIASFSTSESDYATLVAEEHALRRALREISIDARRRVSIYLKG